MIDDHDVLARIETYYDTAPRPLADTEEHGPLTLFVAREGWPYYARPVAALATIVTTRQVHAVLSRQRELGVPRALEWVHETTPSLLAAATQAGMRVEQCPLLVLTDEPTAGRSDLTTRVVSASDPELAQVRAAISVSFGNGGTAPGSAGIAERDATHAKAPDDAARMARMVAAGLSVLVGAFEQAAGAVGGGSHNPQGDVTEIVGVGILPAFRRRGGAGGVTRALACHARGAGIGTVFCSAQDDDVARIYEAVGFHRVGTACIAELD